MPSGNCSSATSRRARLAEVGRQAGVAFLTESVGRSLIAGDIDNDGDLDLLLTNNGAAPHPLRNEGAGAFGQCAAHHGCEVAQSNRDGHRGQIGHGHGRVAAAGSRGACRVQLPRAE